MANLLQINVDEFVKELRAEPRSLAQASAPLVLRAADQAADEIRNAYPIGPPRKQNNFHPGNLKAGVRVRPTKGDPAVSSGVLVSSAHHAHLYEYGTHVAEGKPTFWPIANRYQQQLKADLIALVESRGYTVTGG